MGRYEREARITEQLAGMTVGGTRVVYDTVVTRWSDGWEHATVDHRVVHDLEGMTDIIAGRYEAANAR